MIHRAEDHKQVYKHVYEMGICMKKQYVLKVELAKDQPPTPEACIGAPNNSILSKLGDERVKKTPLYRRKLAYGSVLVSNFRVLLQA